MLVAIDGVDASGKTTFAERLADAVRSHGRNAVIIHADDFLHSRSVRHRRGRESPEGYFADSYDYDALKRQVLAPLSRSGNGWYRVGIADRIRDQLVDRPARHAGKNSVILVEGLFLLRDELVDWWDLSIFLHVDVHTSLRRKERRLQHTHEAVCGGPAHLSRPVRAKQPGHLGDRKW